MIVEDEKSIAGFIKAILNSNGYDAMVAQSGSEALTMISSHCPDLVILDLGLPDMDGMEIITRVRSWTQLPIIVVSARGNAHNSSGTQANGGCFVAGDLTVDYDKHQVLIGGENMKLTQNEYRIVALLSRYAGKVLTYDYIMKELWGPQNGGGNQILRVNMANIRRKIEKNPAEPQYIFTEVGVGYRMIEGD